MLTRIHYLTRQNPTAEISNDPKVKDILIDLRPISRVVSEVIRRDQINYLLELNVGHESMIIDTDFLEELW